MLANGDEKDSKLSLKILNIKQDSKLLFWAHFHVAEPFQLSVGSSAEPPPLSGLRTPVLSDAMQSPLLEIGP